MCIRDRTSITAACERSSSSTPCAATIVRQYSSGPNRVALPLSVQVPWEAVSVHYYTIGGTWTDKGSATRFGPEEYWRTIVAAQGVEELLRSHAAVMDVYDPDKQYGMVLDEWGTWWDVEPGTNPGFLFQQNTLRDAMVAAWHFDVFHRFADRLTMANIAQTVNVLQAMLLTDPDGGPMVRTPTFHVFEMNKGHQDATSLPTHVAVPSRTVAGRDVPVVSASASTKDGTVLVSVTNVDLDAPLEVDVGHRDERRAVPGARGRGDHGHVAPGHGARRAGHVGRQG